MHTLYQDGLNPLDYRPDALLAAHSRALDTPAGGDALARFDVETSEVLLRALRHLHRGKVDPDALDTGWGVPRQQPDFDTGMIAAAISSQRFEQAFAEARPSAAAYERLRNALARYHTIALQGGWPELPPRDRSLRPGDSHDDVLLLRKRLAATNDLAAVGADQHVDPDDPDARRYDEGLEAAVRRFQDRHLLEVDGVVGPRTRTALNAPVEDRIDQIRVNLERARWLFHGLPASFVLVDIAGYQLNYVRPDGDIWRSPVVVGRPYRRTPSLRSEITHLTLNPTWTIPPTILREDVLPQVRQDIAYLERENIQVLDFQGRLLDPATIDWSRPAGYMLRQTPGPHNTLGQVVIRFPNDHMVYLHDTPAKGLFARQQRAFSSGCIRVQGIRELAQLLFDDTGTDQAVDTLLADQQTRNVWLARRVPVILHYWTVHVGEEGGLSFRPDIYDRDQALLEALDRPLHW